MANSAGLPNIQTVLKRVQTADCSITARQAVAVLVHTLRSHGHSHKAAEEATTALRACLGASVPCVVQAAADALPELVEAGVLDQQAALDLLLSSLPTSTSPVCGALATFLVVIVLRPTRATGSHAVSVNHTSARWTQHPLVAAILAQPACGPALVSYCVLSLRLANKPRSVVRSPAGLSAQDVWTRLEPMFAFVLQQGTEGNGGAGLSGLRTLVAAQLLQLASDDPGTFAARVGQVLLCGIRGGGTTDGSDLLQAVSNVLEACELVCSQRPAAPASPPPTAPKPIAEPPAVGGPPLAAMHLACAARDALLTVAADACFAAPGVSDGPVLSHALSGLLRLQQLCPGVLRARTHHVSLLASRAWGKVQEQCLVLLHAALGGHNSPHPGVSPQAAPPAADAAVLVYALVNALAYASGSSATAWASVVLQQVMGVGRSIKPELPHALPAIVDSGSPANPEAACNPQPELSLLDVARTTLAQLGSTAGQEQACEQFAVRWLAALRYSLEAQHGAVRLAQQRARAAAPLPGQLTAASARSAAALDATCDDVHPVAGTVIAALLCHARPSVAVAAVDTAHVLLALQPSAGLPLLPVALFCLRRAAGKHVPGEVSALLLTRYMGLLARLLAHPSSAPLVIRALQPMQATSAPLPLRCLALRTVVTAWLLTGHSWALAESALLGYRAPGSPLPPLPLRLTWAGLLVAVCERDPQRGVDLVAACQEAIRDLSPEVVALGLTALARLCDTDLLDFYKAWKVVAQLHPRLPAHPCTAAAWVAFLGAGHLDAAAYPDQARPLLEGLWAATQHPAPQVRAAAYAALTAFPLEVQEQLEALPGLDVLTAAVAGLPTLSSQASSITGTVATHQGHGFEAELTVRQPAERLAIMGLHYEYDNRRRYFVTASATPAALGGAAATTAGSGSGSSAADEREVAALRHRLLTVVPSALAAGGNARPAAQGSSSSPGLVLPAAAAAQLLTYKPCGGADVASEGGAAGAVSVVVLDALHRLGSGTSAVSCVLPPGWEQSVWTHCFSRVLGAAPNPRAVLGALQSQLVQWCEAGDAAERVAAPLALAGLCVGAPAECEPDVGLLVHHLATGLHAEGASSGTPSETGARLLGLAGLAPSLHSTDDPTRGVIMAALLRHVDPHVLPASRRPRAAAPTPAPSSPATTTAAALVALARFAVAALPHVPGGTVEAPAVTHALGVWVGEDASGRQDTDALGAPLVICAAALQCLLTACAGQGAPASLQGALRACAAGSGPLQAMLQAAQEAAGDSGRRAGGAHLRGVHAGSGSSADSGTPSVTSWAAPYLAVLTAALHGVCAHGSDSQRAFEQLGVALLSHAVSSCEQLEGSPADPGGDATGDNTSRTAELCSAVRTVTALAGVVQLPAPPPLAPGTPHATAALLSGPVRVVAAIARVAGAAGVAVIDGQVRGTAALALGQLCSHAWARQALQGVSADALHLPAAADAGEQVALPAAAIKAMGSGSLAACAQLLASMATGAAGVQHGSHTAAARAGAALGLATLLAGDATAARLLSLLSPQPLGGTSSNGGLLAQLSDSAAAVRACVKVLDGLYRGPAGAAVARGVHRIPGEPEARAAAGLGLALASVSLQHATHSALKLHAGTEEDKEDQGTQAGTGRVKQPTLAPLSRYPEHGPVRQLASALASCATSLPAAVSQRDWSTVGRWMAVAAGVMRCLTRAPRLAAHDLGAAAQLAVQAAAQLTDGGVGSQALPPVVVAQAGEVQVAAVQLALAHGRDADTGLATFLNAWLSPGKLLTWHAAAACDVARALPDVAAAVAPGRTARFLCDLAETVAALLTGAQRAPPGWNSTASVLLAAAVWDGVGGLLHSPHRDHRDQRVGLGLAASHVHADIQRAAVQAAAVLYGVLPVPAGLLPGELITIRAEVHAPPPSGPTAASAHVAQALSAVPDAADVSGVLTLPLTVLVSSGWGNGTQLDSCEHSGLSQAGPPTDAQQRSAVLTLWAAAVRALRACHTPGTLPRSLTADDTLLRPEHEPEAEAGGAAQSAAARCAVARSLLVWCSGGSGGAGAGLLNAASLAPARAWLLSQDTATSAPSLAGVRATVRSALSVAITETTPPAQLVPLWTSVLIAGTPGSLVLATRLAAAAVCQAAVAPPSAAVEAVVAQAVVCADDTDSEQSTSGAALPYLVTRLARGPWSGLVEPLVQGVLRAHLTAPGSQAPVVRACLQALMRVVCEEAQGARHGGSAAALADVVRARLDATLAGVQG